MEDDPFYRLEHFAAADGSGRTADQVRGKEARSSLHQLKSMQDVRSSEDGNLNKLLRKSFQKQKKDDVEQGKAEAAERERLNMHIPLLPASADDTAAAQAQVFGSRVQSEEQRYEAAERRARASILNAPIFQRKPAPSTPQSSRSSTTAPPSTSLASSSMSALDKVRALALSRAGGAGVGKNRRLSAAARAGGGGGGPKSSLTVGATVIRRRSAGDAPLGLGRGGF